MVFLASHFLAFSQAINVVEITRAKLPNNTVLKILFSIIIVSL